MDTIKRRTLSGKIVERPVADVVTTYELGILRGLQDMRVYGGTVPGKVKAQRRAAGKIARASRRRNRGQR